MKIKVFLTSLAWWWRIRIRKNDDGSGSWRPKAYAILVSIKALHYFSNLQLRKSIRRKD